TTRATHRSSGVLPHERACRRIDHHIATAGLAARATSAVVKRAPSHGKRWSDHAPVTVASATGRMAG
ncbi:MAG: hypothetical protein L0H64_10055, partial [Pseudonocardia sp.]|nr:hypothetical protein [Pseudonocardia sp.]